jgi:hypothetical protein
MRTTPMRPTRVIPPGSMLQDYPTPLPDVPIENLDAPAYTRTPTSLPEFQRQQAIQAYYRVDATNRTFNQQFWTTMRSEAGGVTSGIDLTGLAKWVSEKLSRKQGGGSVARDEDIHKW